MPFATRPRPTLGFWLALIVLIAVSAVAYTRMSALLAAGAEQDHLRALLAELETTLSLLKDAETGQRGYLLTGDESYLGPYRQAAAELDGHFARLDELARGDADEQAGVAAFRELAGRKMAELRRTVALRQAGRADAALDAVRGGEGQQVMHDTRRRVDALQDGARVRLLSNIQEEARLAHATRGWVVGGSALAVVLLGAATLLLGRAVARRQRLAEQAVRSSEEQNRLLLDSTGEGICGMDRDGQCTFSNPAAARMLGYDGPHSLLGRDLHDLVHHHRPDGTPYPAEECPIGAANRRGETVHADAEVFWRADGSSFPVEYRANPVRRDGAVVGTVVAFQDITPRQQAEEALRRTEEQYRQAQKMEAVGQLAGGVAHDFNNLLTVINGYAALLQEQFPPADPGRALVEEVRQAGDRAAVLTRQLLAFSRKQVLAPRVLDLNAVVEGVGRMLRRLIGEDVQLVTALDPAAGPVRADPGQLEQVLLNLAVNARDAMPRGGRLTVETRNVELDDGYARAHLGVAPGPYVLLAVSDTGQGMTEEIKRHIFEPFFTTKGPGKGTGLGLATVYGIVRQSGGSVYVYSEPGRGASFKIYLPRAGEPAPAGAAAAADEWPRGSGTVLLVEDEDGVRGLADRVLTASGYTVLAARDGAEGLQVAQGFGGPIHLLITDVVMPGLGGHELAGRLAALRPGIKVLYFSGYTDDAVVRHGILSAEVAFLEKPFTPAALARKVRAVLG